jgi:hypothetical protein
MKARVSALGLAVLVCIPVRSLLAVQNCNTQDFNGTYGIVAHGAVTVPGFSITGPFARAGQVVADGHGNLVFNTTASYNGFLFSEAISATYTMSADCSMTFNVEPFAPIFQNATFKALLSDNKRQVDFMIADPHGQVISAVLKKQDDKSCNARNFSGPYVVHMTGSVVIPPAGTLPGDFVRVGKLVSDGHGGFSAETNVNYSGLLIRAENFAGTYTVATNCTVNIQYTFGSVPYVWSGALVANGAGVDLVAATAGLSVAGELTGQ